MDESVRAAMVKWPDVPGVHGWLSLDESGQWRLKGEAITHGGLIAFINRNYDCDEQGRWFFQNGPQRGYVELAYTPWVLHVDGSGRLYHHTGAPVERIEGAWLDDEGNLLLQTSRGIGLVDSDSLPAVAEWLVDADDHPLEPEALVQAQQDQRADPQGSLILRAGPERRLSLGLVPRGEVPRRFGFVPQPRAD